MQGLLGMPRAGNLPRAQGWCEPDPCFVYPEIWTGYLEPGVLFFVNHGRLGLQTCWHPATVLHYTSLGGQHHSVSLVPFLRSGPECPGLNPSGISSQWPGHPCIWLHPPTQRIHQCSHPQIFSLDSNRWTLVLSLLLSLHFFGRIWRQNPVRSLSTERRPGGHPQLLSGVCGLHTRLPVRIS